MHPGKWHIFFSSWSTRLAVGFLLFVILLAVFAPWLWTQNPVFLDPMIRLQGPSSAHWLGTDFLGRDVYSRIIYGSRISLTIGIGVVFISVIFGTTLGAIAAYFRHLDGIIMRVMDGIMAVPDILLAIALVAITGASLEVVIIAISLPQIPRVARVVRSIILTVREEPYVEAAITLGTSPLRILLHHMLPNTVPILIVQGTYIFAWAVALEAILGFLGAGVPPEIPSWGNVIAAGRIYFQLDPGLILYPSVILSLTILVINVIGDAARDALDPKLDARN